jgi:hypothetical protein
MRQSLRAVSALLSLCIGSGAALATAECPAVQALPQVMTDPGLCASLEDVVRKPAALPLDQYEAKLGTYLRAYCHRNPASGWVSDKTIRDTGPFTATLKDGKWAGTYNGTHAPVIIWYSPEMVAWLKANRPVEEHLAPATAAPVPDGAVMVKEMYPAPAAACRGDDPARLLPTSGAAIMVRDAKASHDGWFWGWFGWSGWAPDWPPEPTNGYPNMGFGQYCTNCHASARDNSTFAALRNLKGQPGTPLVFLSQHWFQDQFMRVDNSFANLLNHARVVAEPTANQQAKPHPTIDPAFAGVFRAPAGTGSAPVAPMPSQTYDNAWVGTGAPKAKHQFVTSDQCIGCHAAGSTGIQFDMTEPRPDGKLVNLSPHGTWRTSPMGLAGRDPVFLAQLASETETFHPEAAAVVQDTCLGCHGIMGQRQFKIDQSLAGAGCTPFSRAMVDSVPWPAGPGAANARYGALSRDGISCMACHTMALTEAERTRVKDAPQNSCMGERQDLLNPSNTGFAKTFTGSFLVGAPGRILGPFEAPRAKPMENALGFTPVHDTAIKSAEVCGSCHTVHLPILQKGKVIGHTYEQTTYAEWAFSDYRTGDTPDGPLPSGPGPRAQTCQGCHMPSRSADGRPYRSKIASIQEYSNFPQAENVLPPADIDLPVREGFASHVLVGLNAFLIKMAQQFPDLLGIRTEDPMLGKKGVDPLVQTEREILRQAAETTADIAIRGVSVDGDALSATVAVANKTGHKFPSGVGFRRAFIEFQVLDRDGAVLWASGRTNAAGVITDERGEPVAGELWWKTDCSARTDPLAHQPHREVITRQGEAQVYQELVSTPPREGPAQCGHHAKPAGELTTSFLSICTPVKDNRLLPHGFRSREERVAIAAALGAGPELADDAGAIHVGGDPDYGVGGGDSTTYRVNLAELPGTPASVQATLYYQATPPFYLQDRFCTSKSPDTQRLFDMAGRLNLKDTPAEGWKLRTVSTGRVPLSLP